MNKPTQPRVSQWVLAAAVAALPTLVFAPSASAQQRIGSDGHARDANNQIGGSGYNTPSAGYAPGQYGNDVVNGNVSGGRQFRGSTPSSDFGRFHGNSPGVQVDNFAKDSAAPPLPNQPAPDPNTSQPYFGLSRNAPPPPGFTQTPNSIGFVQAAPIAAAQPNDLRLGNVEGTTNVPLTPRPGELNQPGPVDPRGGANAPANSPLYGLRQNNGADANDQFFMNRFTGNQGAAGGRLDPGAVERMRQELRNGPLNNNGNNNAQPQQPGVGDAPSQPQDMTLARPLGQPFENPGNQPVSAQPLSSNLRAGSLNGSIATDQSALDRVLGSPAQQSKQYDELHKRLERYYADQRNPEQESARRYNEQMAAKARKEADAAAVAAGGKPPTPDKSPANPAVTPQPGTANAPGGKAPPIKVPSLVDGMSSKGLAEMLKQAEDLMKEGKYSAAIDKYADAGAVAPNQPLIWIGRANAELGASYYGRAEQHLKDAFSTDKSLLMAQYDLRSFLGEERLAAVIKDLKEIAQNDANSPTPVFLLAYVAYNTGNEARAAGYLDLAEKRAGGKDPIYKVLRDHWSLPVTDPAKPTDLKELNK